MATVRPADPRDAEGITRVHIHGWQWGYAALMPASYLGSLDETWTQRVERRRAHLGEGREVSPVFVATDSAGEVIGFANVGRYRNNQDINDLVDSPVGEIYAIYVGRDVAGTGVGRALMDASVDWLRGRELDPVRLWVLEGNARARAFYERYGFRNDGVRSTCTLEHPGEVPIELPEIRLSLALGVRGRDRRDPVCGDAFG
jgi:GNAT superfamily N-acetyltransferase